MKTAIGVLVSLGFFAFASSPAGAQGCYCKDVEVLTLGDVEERVQALQAQYGRRYPDWYPDPDGCPEAFESDEWEGGCKRDVWTPCGCPSPEWTRRSRLEPPFEQRGPGYSTREQCWCEDVVPLDADPYTGCPKGTEPALGSQCIRTVQGPCRCPDALLR